MGTVGLQHLVQGLSYGGAQGVKLGLCLGGEGESGVVQRGSRLGQVDYIITDALEIRQGVKQIGY